MIDKDNDIVGVVYNLVFDSPRQMPAHFCSNNGRTQSFCINFNDLEADDEYNMASVTYYSVENFIKEVEDTWQRTWIVKLAEDAMAGSYIIAKMGRQDLAHALEKELTHENIERFRGQTQDIDVDKIYAFKGVREYLNYCVEAGCKLALTGKMINPEEFIVKN